MMLAGMDPKATCISMAAFQIAPQFAFNHLSDSKQPHQPSASQALVHLVTHASRQHAMHLCPQDALQQS